MGDMELQIFADRLKELRTEKDLTQAQFVDGLGITASALSAYEKNLKNPSISVAKRIADKYHVSIDWLCGLSEQKNIVNTIDSYHDLFKVLFSIGDACGNILCFTHALEVAGFDLKDAYDFNSITFSDRYTQKFLTEWAKMKKLHDDCIIDDEVYNLWKEKTLNKEYSFKLDDDFTDKIKSEDDIMGIED